MSVYARISGHIRTYIRQLLSNHQAFGNINQQSFKNWAASISPDVVEFINGMFNGVTIEQIRYRGCLGIQKLCRANKDIFLKAVRLCNENKVYTFKSCNDIFKHLISIPSTLEETPIKNDNLRGKESFRGEE